MTNLSKTPHINFYQNLSSIVEVMTKRNLVCFYGTQCTNMNIFIIRIFYYVDSFAAVVSFIFFKFNTTSHRPVTRPGGAENAGPENGGPENVGPNFTRWNLQDWKMQDQ